VSPDPSPATDYPVIKEPEQIARVFAKAWKSAHNTDVIVGAETNIVDQDGVFRSADYRQP
jgi:hypothetical protein